MRQVSKILFCHETPHFSGILCAHHQELSAVHVAIGTFHARYVAAAWACLTVRGRGPLTGMKRSHFPGPSW
jgi:hypothetical protein